MTTEEYLSQVCDIELRIKSLESELHDSEAESDEKYREYLQSQIKSDIEKCKGLKIKIRNEIQSIPDNTYATLLSEKYIRGASWEQVAERLSYSDKKHVSKVLHSKALKAFEKLYENNYKNSPLYPTVSPFIPDSHVLH